MICFFFFFPFFFFQFVYIADYIGGILYIEPFLHLWDEANLIMVDDFSDVFLDSVCEYFIEYFRINVHEWNWSAILFLSNIFASLGYQGNCNLIKRVWQWLFCFYIVEYIKEYRYQLFLEVLVEFCIETIWSWAFLVGRLLITASN